MMDMGGVASAESNTKLNLGKNNRVTVVALDFALLTQSIQNSVISSHSDSNNSSVVGEGSNNNTSNRIEHHTIGKVQPDISMVQNFARLLNVTLNDGDERLSTSNHTKRKGKERDDMSLLLGTNQNESDSGKEDRTVGSSSLPNMDIRAKYAQKLKDKIQGGLAGVDSAKFHKEETLAKGDAAGHLVARSIAASQTVATSGSKWLATTGAGTLLTFLDKRCLSIALLPPPTFVSQEEKDSTIKSMQELTQQLPNVKFDVLLSCVTGMDSSQDNDDTSSTIKQGTPASAGAAIGSGSGDRGRGEATKILIHRLLQEKHDIPTTKILVVSDQDAYLRQARDCGMLTCRVRPKNAPRGNVTTSYTVERISEVQNAVNDLIGISFNTVFSSR